MHRPAPSWTRTLWVTVLLWLLERATDEADGEAITGKLTVLSELNVQRWQVVQLVHGPANDP